MSGNPQMFEYIFQLRLTSKMLERSSKKALKESKAKEKQVAIYVKKGDLEIARIHAQDAMRKKQESLNYLKLAARVDGMKPRLETMSANQQLTRQLAQMTKALEQSTQSMNVLEVAKVMDRFAMNEENITVMENTVADGVDRVTATMINQTEVDDLIRQVADEYSLEVHTLLPDLAPPVATTTPATKTTTGPSQNKALYS